MNIIVALLAMLLPAAKIEGVLSFLDNLAKRIEAEQAKQMDQAEALRAQAQQLLVAAQAADAKGDRLGRLGGKLTDLVA
jgi:hypothetical protein